MSEDEVNLLKEKFHRKALRDKKRAEREREELDRSAELSEAEGLRDRFKRIANTLTSDLVFETTQDYKPNLRHPGN
jgi:hypothetical protein